jgi:Ni2+-binding GTPase involved in maturation of urease and hydrogenase
MTRARYIMIGGFLGAGKTTAVLRLAEHLSAAGKRVGLITNDQSVGLVDTTLLESHGFAVEEITGGCFCCRFNSLVDAADRLSADSRPEVFIAEPVGSCTDLKASVSYPLRRMYGEDYSVAPLSVLVDPIRALRILGLEEGKAFSPKVVYVYLKQLEEAEFIVVNKMDLLGEDRRRKLRDALAERFPQARVFEISARHKTGLDAWFNAIAGGDLGSAAPMDVDYELYAEGEALLGWMNCSVEVTAAQEVDGNAMVSNLASHIQQKCAAENWEIAHLKMTLTPDAGNDLAVLNVSRNDSAGELSHRLAGHLDAGELIINLRAEADPASLAAAVHTALADESATRNWTYKIEHEESFRPGKPMPTFRDATA